MKIHLRFDSFNEQHSHMTLFINGKNNGTLVMSPAEADWFYFVLERGCNALKLGVDDSITFVGSGHNAKDGDPIRPLP